MKIVVDMAIPSDMMHSCSTQVEKEY